MAKRFKKNNTAESRGPKSQSEKAAAKKAKALEAAGTAIIEGNPAKAKKIMAGEKKAETKKPSAKQATEILAEAHVIEMQITALDHKIEGVKEHYKGLKSDRERLVIRLRSEVRDMGQGRLPFQDGVAHAKPKGAKKGKADDAQIEAELEAAASKDPKPGEIGYDSSKGNGAEHVNQVTGEIHASDEKKESEVPPKRGSKARGPSNPKFGAMAEA